MNLLDILIPVARAQEAVKSTSPVAVLGLNLGSFIAQLVNVGIALFILWKFAFTPIVSKLQERATKIEKSLNDADRIQKEKMEFEHWRQEEMGKARTEASSIVTKAQGDATVAKDQILHQTKEDQQKLIEQAKKQIEQEKNQALQSAKGELADLVTQATEKILRQKLDGKKDAELIRESIKSI